MKERLMSLKAINDLSIYKSVPTFSSDVRHWNSKEASTNSEGSVSKQGCSATDKNEIKYHSTSLNIQDKSVTKSINTTAVNDYSGRLSFKGAPVQNAEKIGGPILQAIAKNKGVQSFIKMADKNMLVFEAMFALLINGTLRPASIMLMPTDDKEKNKKAAAHSISSGLMGFVVAQAITLPLQASMKKIKTNPNKYLLTKSAKKMFGDFKNTKAATAEKFFSKLMEMSLVPVRAAMTVAMLPVIDKHIISKIFGPVKSKEKTYPLYFKGSEPKTDSFKKIKEGRAK